MPHKDSLCYEKPIVPKLINDYQHLLHSLRSEIYRQVEKLPKDDIIEESNSSFLGLIIWIAEKNNPSKTGEKKWRLVIEIIDYQALNEKGSMEIFPLPNIADILDRLLSSAHV